MTKCNCYIYPTPSDKIRNEFIDLLAKEANLDREKVVEFMNENNQYVFKNIEKDRALSIISEFEKIDIIGSIGTLNKYHQKKFKKFKHGFVPNWNWAAAIFSWTWLLFKGLWGKIAIYSMAWFILETMFPKALFELFASPNSFIYLVTFGGITYLGMFGSYDYYLKKVKGEAFWPLMPYVKYKLPFWIVFLVFIGGSLAYPLIDLNTYATNLESNKVSSFAQDNFVFDTFPERWTVYQNPPASFSLTLSRSTSSNSTETISCCQSLEPQLIGWIQKARPSTDYDNKHIEGMGLVGLGVKSSGLFQKFDSVRDESIEKMAYSIVGGDEHPFFMKWMERWFPQPILKISYEELLGREWGKAAIVQQIKMMDEEMKFFMTVYWTVANDKAIFFLSIPFSPYKDEIDNEVKEFLKSLAIREDGY